MNNLYIKNVKHIPKWFLIDAKNKTLGRLASNISKLLLGKQTSYYTPGLDLGNFIIVINSLYIRVTGNKETKKIYYSNSSHRPGNLKKKTFIDFQQTIPTNILKKSIWGMLPKNKTLSRLLFNRLYIYKTNKINYILKKNINNFKFITL